MSKRAQESTAKEGSAVAKPRPDEFGVKEPPGRTKTLRKIRVIRTAWGIKSWVRVLFHEAPGNWCETATKTQQHILNSGDKMALYLQGAPGNLCQVITVKSKGQD